MVELRERRVKQNTEICVLVLNWKLKRRETHEFHSMFPVSGYEFHSLQKSSRPALYPLHRRVPQDCGPCAT